MKRLLFLILFILTFGYAADVKPLYFDNVPDSAQQTSWETLMQYKTFGAYDRAIINFRIKCDEKLYYVISLENSINSFHFEFIENGFIQSRKHIYMDDDLEVFEKLLSNAMESMVENFSK